MKRTNILLPLALALASALHPQTTSGGTSTPSGGPLLLPPRASATFRNGSGVNPASYLVQAPPVLGGEFRATVDVGSSLGAFLVGYTAPARIPTSVGEALVHPLSPGGELLGPFTGPYIQAGTGIADVRIPVPNDPTLSGFRMKTQAIEFGGGAQLTNAQDLVFGT